MTLLRAAVLLLVATSAAACGLPRLPDAAQYCQMSFDDLERRSCRAGESPESLKMWLGENKKICHDPASLERIKKIESGCLVGLKTALRDRADERRKIRAKYVDEVSALLLDPAYPPLADRYRDSKDQSALSELDALARKHGIDPRYAKVLELW